MTNDEMFNIEETIYNETFDKTYRFLKAGLTNSLDYDINALHNTIETLTTYYGNNQSGRGDLSQTRITAEIAATEAMLSELIEAKKKEA